MHVPAVNSGARISAACGCGLLLLLAPALTCFARHESNGEKEHAWKRTTLRSPAGRFIVSAEDPADRLIISRWADDVYRRFYKIWCVEPFLPEEQVFGIVVDPLADDVLPGGLEIRRRVDSDKVKWTLFIEDLATLDGERFVEALSSMIIDAMIVEAQPEAERTVFDEPSPAWLSVGVAQNLYTALSIRNQDLVLGLWAGGQLPGGWEILSWRYMSPCRSFEYAVSGLWVAWAAGPHPQQRADTLQHWIGLLAEGRAITPELLSKEPLCIESAWEPYVASLQRLFTAGQGAGAAMAYERLRRAMTVTPRDMGIPPNIELDGEGLDALIPWRRQSWFRHFARIRRGELAVLSAGADPDYQALINRVIDFINKLEKRRLSVFLHRKYGAIMESLENQESLALLREQYVSLFEKKHLPPAIPAWLDDDRPDAFPRSRLRKYVDEFDKP